MGGIFKTLGPLLGTCGGMGIVAFSGMLFFRILRKQEKKNTVVALCLCIVCLIVGILLTPDS